MATFDLCRGCGVDTSRASCICAGMKPKLDVVNHPPHYKVDGLPECIDVIEALGLGYHLGNAIKYLWRAGRKDVAKTTEDLRKAAWYINREVERRERLAKEGKE